MNWVSESSPACEHGPCDNNGCNWIGDLAVTYTEMRREGKVRLRFCTRSCFRDWLNRVHRLPDPGLKVNE